jgi:N-methylhydantoinase A
MRALSVGVDVGGTFTDLVAWDASGTVTTCKVPTSTPRPADGVLRGIAQLTGDGRVATSLAHGTTIVTNAIVEKRTAAVGLVTTRGFRDVLEIARQSRTHLYRLDAPAKPEALVPRRWRAEVTERVAVDGTILTPLALDDLPAIVERFKADGIESVAVCLLHAYANPAHERAVREALAPHFRHVTISSEINAEFREYERACTTVLNASVMPLATKYLEDLSVALRGASRVPRGATSAGGLGAISGPPCESMRLHLLHSAGGMMSVPVAAARPLAMAMSGPAAGVAAAAHVARTLGLARALAFDMGGTTTDVCLIADGQPETASQRRLGEYPVRLPMVAVESIGAGGGSIAHADAAGALKVGPQSAGALPGPACYGLGGEAATVTDANVLLGYLNLDRTYGGAIRIDPERARVAVDALAKRWSLSLLEAAHGVVEIANANMLRALRLVSVQRGRDLRDFTLIAYGGAGPMHAGALARMAGIGRVIVPAHSGAFSALGCLVSPLRYDAVVTHRARLDAWDGKRADDAFGDLEAQCVTPLLEEDIDRARITLVRSVDLRYSGQNYEIEVGWDPDLTALRAAFEGQHRRLYGYATGESVECVNLRLTARVLDRALELPRMEPVGALKPTGEQRAYFRETGETAMPRYARAAFGPARTVAGPALVEDDWSTTIVYPGQRCHGDHFGNLILEEAN